jgi:flavin reductase (DIM6/NTAB) family NADH-FMN oxidoreductase RutF
MTEKRLLESRDALRMLAPGPVALISSMYRDHPNLMTAAWMLPLSLHPTWVGVAIQPARLTHEYVTRSEQFAINIPNLELLSAIHLCGMRSGREGDKFEASRVTPADAQEIDAPLVAECVGHIECSVIDRITLGDHDLFVGEVRAVSAALEAFSEVWDVAVDAGKLLHHLGGDRYAGLDRMYRASLPKPE